MGAGEGVTGHADIVGNSAGRRDLCPEPVQNAAHGLPGMFAGSEEEARPLPERHVQAGRRAVALLALRVERGRIL